MVATRLYQYLPGVVVLGEFAKHLGNGKQEGCGRQSDYWPLNKASKAEHHGATNSNPGCSSPLRRGTPLRLSPDAAVSHII